MFCSDVFLNVIKDNFVYPTATNIVYHYPTHSIDKNTLMCPDTFESEAGPFVCAYEEPLDNNILNNFENYISEIETFNNHNKQTRGFNNHTRFLINSEHSQLKNIWIKKHRWVDWYCFYHGFAALYWYNRFQFFPKNNSKFTHVFINYNNLITGKRSYRLHFVAQLLNKNLDQFGLISMPVLDKNPQIWADEILSSNSFLSVYAKKILYTNFNANNKKFILDIKEQNGSYSADINTVQSSQALFEVVSETVFYDQKLHLTEKIFKPIVCRQPFILIAAPGNLKYLKSYGFKTFDRWIDESYDEEIDSDLRIQKIVLEIDKLSKLSYSQLQDMHHEMQEIIDYNFYYFYTDFKKKIVNEMIDNFEKALHIFNYDASERFRINFNSDLNEIRKRFLY
jgi:hypothetical protein